MLTLVKKNKGPMGGFYFCFHISTTKRTDKINSVIYIFFSCSLNSLNQANPNELSPSPLVVFAVYAVWTVYSLSHVCYTAVCSGSGMGTSLPIPETKLNWAEHCSAIDRQLCIPWMNTKFPLIRWGEEEGGRHHDLWQTIWGSFIFIHRTKLLVKDWA